MANVYSHIIAIQITKQMTSAKQVYNINRRITITLILVAAKTREREDALSKRHR